MSPEMQKMVAALSGGMGILLGVIGILGALFIIFGGVKMLRRENHGLCVAASIVAMVPCVSACCLIGLPIGIWALVILSKPETKAVFH